MLCNILLSQPLSSYQLLQQCQWC